MKLRTTCYAIVFSLLSTIAHTEPSQEDENLSVQSFGEKIASYLEAENVDGLMNVVDRNIVTTEGKSFSQIEQEFKGFFEAIQSLKVERVETTQEDSLHHRILIPIKFPTGESTAQSYTFAIQVTMDEGEYKITDFYDTTNPREEAERALSNLSSSPDPHEYLNASHRIITHPDLLDLAEKMVEKGLAINTVENLARVHPATSNLERQQNLEFAHLYGQQAWILWKTNRRELALDVMGKAMTYKTVILSPSADDYLRLGLIEYDNGKRQQGWEHVNQALIMDFLIEAQNPDYRLALDQIIKDQLGPATNRDTFLAELRAKHIDVAPNLKLETLEGVKINFDLYKGRVIFVTFFSPRCGSCRQEMKGLDSFYEEFVKKNVTFLFLLNLPELRKETLKMVDKSAIHPSDIVILEEGSAYDLIPGEPTVWIIDQEGKVTFKHSGYQPDDAMVYRNELSKLIQN